MEPKEFKRAINDANSMEPPVKEPWLPFRSREDFDFAAITHDAAMNQLQINNLLDLFHRCQQGSNKVSFKNYSELKRSWDDAGKLLTDVLR